ncbi:hypothetical protein [Telmatospirillum siberiense]|uniref:Uncharacterized protein n=1 Tax=Telmatospirillum siberiense TaxID=382514 RepID=A0A2N3PRM4_9PROT|nr:hypothetical protein [Telmatospirillum siberiense]PKU23057.1 hypothetical protein CWS72_18660 [Telmatospirillum siberiense]
MGTSARWELRRQADAQTWDEREQADLLISFIQMLAARDGGIIENLRNFLAATADEQNRTGRQKTRPWEFRPD